LAGRLVGRVGVEPGLLGADRVLQALDLEAVELGLELLPRPAEDVVIRHRPQGADEEEQRTDEPECAVGALLVVEGGGVAARHLRPRAPPRPAQPRGSRSRPSAKKARPESVKYSSRHVSSCATPR